MLAASVLWKLSEYQDFVAPLLKAEAAEACADAVEDLGPPLAGPLRQWLQVSAQVCRSGAHGKIKTDPPHSPPHVILKDVHYFGR